MNSIHCVQLVSDMLVFQFSNQQNFFSSLSQYVPQQLPGYGAVQIKSSARHILPISCFVCVRYPLSYCSCYTSYQFSFDDVRFINNNKNHFLLTNRLGVLPSFTHVLNSYYILEYTWCIDSNYFYPQDQFVSFKISIDPYSKVHP